MKKAIETEESAAIIIKVREAQVQQLYKHSGVALSGALVIAVSICTVLWDVIPQWKLLLWVGVFVLVTIARGFIAYSFQRKSPSGPNINHWAKLHVIGVAAASLMWAMPSIFLWPVDSPIHQMVWPICIVALTASAVAMYCTWTPSYLSFLILSVTPISIRLLSEGGLEYIVTGLLGFFFIGVLIQTGKVMHEATLSAFMASIRNEALSSVLAEDKAKVEELNGQLQQEVAKRARSQEELELKNEALERSHYELEVALASVKQLSGMLPICASCKKIRNDKGYWEQIEAYIRDHSEVEFSHGICPECAKKLYAEYTDKREG